MDVVSGTSVSAREAEVLAALAEHLTNAEIAARLYISVRTVESHVSSLLRKFQVDDRRALAGLAPAPTAAARPAAPRPLTSFVGRTAERTALADALIDDRLVTAVGPGGVGKTRLALSVLEDVVPRFAGGAWFVDLVPVTDPAAVDAAVARVLGLGGHQSRSAADALLAWLGDREVLLVLDNCEHLLDGVVVLLERLLASCPSVRVLATSRARLLVPFERVFPVPGLALEPDASGRCDAVTLFHDRAAAAGSPVPAEAEERVLALCRALDGMALAIELAAARLPSLGLDGLAAGLSDQLQLLAGGRRVDDRHHSLRSTLAWSHALLSEPERAVFRRISCFAAPFTAADAAAVLDGWAPVPDGALPGILAALADQSLLVAAGRNGCTRYRMPETLRQYGAEQLAELDETDEARVRHLRWCRTVAAGIDLCGRADAEELDAQRAAFDAVADELRAALRWAEQTDGRQADAYALAGRLAELAFGRGLLAESQRRYEQAARVAADDLAAAAAYRAGAGAAAARHYGDDALRLYRSAADAAVRAGERPIAASDLARAAELINRGPGLLSTLPAPGTVDELLAEARLLAGDDEQALARTLIAQAYTGTELDPLTRELTDRAVVVARRVGDPLAESAALDQLTAIQLALGDYPGAVASVRRRTELLAPLPICAETALEFFDAYGMATDTAVSAGDLRAGRRFAEGLCNLPFHYEEGHLATVRLLLVTALEGEWAQSVRLARRFRTGWERAGRPRAGNLSRGAYAAATVFGLRGENAQRAEWLDVVAGLATPGRPLTAIRVGQYFDAVLLMHRGEYAAAVEQLTEPPEGFRRWYNGLWRPWYAAAWAEAAVLAGTPDAAQRTARARLMAAGNPIAEALVARAEALRSGERGALPPIAAALAAAGCRYQWARTRILAGGDGAERGRATLAAMGAAPMAVPPG